MVDNKKLTEKQKRFCEEYVIDLNATKAALRAGYKHEDMGRRIVTKSHISGYIQELRDKQQKRTEITADMVIKELAKLAFSDIRDIYDENGRMFEPHELPEEISATISSFKVRTEKSSDETLSVIEEYKRYDKPKALEMLGRHFGLFTDKIEHSGDVGGVLVVPSTVSQDEWVKLAKAQQKEIKEK